MYNTYYVDLSKAIEKKDLYVAFKDVPHPDYAEDNLDSMYDVLTSFTSPTRIVLNDVGGYQEKFPEYFESFIQMCEDATSENENLEVLFMNYEDIEDLDA